MATEIDRGRGRWKDLSIGYEEALSRLPEALAKEGFGIITQIDIQETFKSKLGVDFRRYVILGACNPPLAFKAITTDPSVGLLLPCNVTIEWIADGRTGVRLTDPEALLSTAALEGAPELASVARDARERMLRVKENLSNQ